MKTQIQNSRISLLYSFAILLILQLGCTGLGKSDVEGSYLNNAGSEFSQASDTLVVEHAEGKQYLIHRKTGFHLLDAMGKPGKLQHEREEWTAIIDEKTGILTEQRSGKLIRFSDGVSMMQVGKRNYKRIN
jgi:hypothetical protein